MSVNLAGLSVFVLHNEVPTSLELNATIANAGCRKISTFYYCSIAQLWLDRFTPNLAILELSINDHGCFDLVASLIERGIPVVIYSEDGHPPKDPGSALCGVQWIAKEAAPHVVRAAIRSAFSTMDRSHAVTPVVQDQSVENFEETSENGSK